MQAGPIHHRLGLHHGPDPNHRPNLRVRQSRFVQLTPETKLHMLSLVQLFKCLWAKHVKNFFCRFLQHNQQ